MSIEQLAETARAMVAPGKGIIAIDESTTTIAKRFDGVGIPNSEENRRAYSRHAGARRRMAMIRDVFPMDYDSRGQTPREAARGSINMLADAGLLGAGERVVFTSGEHMESTGATNTLRLLQVDKAGKAARLGEL